MDEFAALADPTRREIIELLAKRGRLSASEIADQFSVTPQAISQHLKILREARLVQMEKQAQQRIYQVNLEAVQKLETWTQQITQLWQERYSSLKKLLEEKKRQKKGGSA